MIRRLYSTRSKLSLRKPAYPVRRILENPELFSRSVAARKVVLYKNQSVDDLVAQHGKLADLRKQRSQAGFEHNAVIKKVKDTVSQMKLRDVLPPDLKDESEASKRKLAQIDNALQVVEHEFDELLDSMPNLVEPNVLSFDGEYEVVSMNEHAKLGRNMDLKCDHVDIGQQLGILDISNASRVSGMGNVYLLGQGALLEQALIQYAIRKCTSEFGLKMVIPPALVRSEYNSACGFRPRGESTQVYEVAGANLCLSGTAEIPLASQLALQSLPAGDLPLKHCGLSRSFRAEAGSRGSETRGLYRLHEFSKVEMFCWCAPEDSEKMLQELLSFEKKIFEDLLGELGVPLRTINIGPGDLGNPAYQKYDIEAWMPSRGTWGELSSASNCLDFQSRRLHTKVKDTNEFVHTLNATALAVPRVIIAILEHGFNRETGEVRLPKALWPFMNSKIIAKEKNLAGL